MIDVARLRESNNKREASNTGLVTTENKMADATTRRKCDCALEFLIKTGIDTTPVAQLVIRPAVDPPYPTTGGRKV